MCSPKLTAALISTASALLLTACAQQGANSPSADSGVVMGVEYGDLNRGAQQPRAKSAAAPAKDESGARVKTASNLPTLDAEQKAMIAREVEGYKKFTGFPQLESSKGADQLPFMQGGYTQTPDGTASVGAAGVGSTLKDAHDAAIIAVQRAMMRQGSVPASRVVISQGAFRRLADGWQVFVQGQAGPGAVAKFQLNPAKVEGGKEEKLALPDLEDPRR